MISIICVYNNESILKEDLLDSLEDQTTEYELILVDNSKGKFKSAAEALNWGGKKAKGKYLMFVHQDVHLCSKSWLETTEKLLDSIPNLGIAGTAGARKSESPRIVETVTNIMQGIPPVNVPGAVPLQEPVRVQTLDESLVIIPRAVFDILQFDEEVCDDWNLLYAVDYSLSVSRLGLGVYVIPSFIHHRSTGKCNENTWQMILSMGFFYSGYYRILKKLLKKHRPYTRHVYGTTGQWSTSYPLILRRVEEVRHAVYHQILSIAYYRFLGGLYYKTVRFIITVYYRFLGGLHYKTVRFIITKGIISKARDLFKQILYGVKQPPEADAQKQILCRVKYPLDAAKRKLKRACIAARYLHGQGIMLGGSREQLEVPSCVRILSGDLMSDNPLRPQHLSLADMPFIRVNIFDDIQKLSSIDNDSQDFVIATGVLERFENSPLALHNMLRVVKRCGVIYMSTPYDVYTFDADRSLNPLNHISGDYKGQPDKVKKNHLEQLMSFFPKVKDKEGIKHLSVELRKIRVLECLFATSVQMNLPFVVGSICCEGDEAIVILRKSPRLTP